MAKATKAAEAFRTISEVADDLRIPKHVLRFWESKFPQVKPMKRGGGRRYYRPEDLELLRGIKRLLHNEGFTIRGVQKILREGGPERVKAGGREGEPAIGATGAARDGAPAGPRRRGRPPRRTEQAETVGGGMDERRRAVLLEVARELRTLRDRLLGRSPVDTNALSTPRRAGRKSDRAA
jgi:DNA-binding transcriptional MerR regulator